LDDLLGVWGRLVQSYTTLEITEVSDRLPAIAGIAQRFAPYMGDMQYSAGLWQDPSGILTTPQLLWFTETPAPRPAACETPTWSWASVASPVLDATPERNEEPGRRRFPLAGCREPIQLGLEGPSRYGPVNKGVIQLQAKLFPATLELHDFGGEWGKGLLLEMRECGGHGFVCELDTSDVDPAAPIQVVCTTVQEVLDSSYEFIRLEGLVLRPIENPKGRYQRLGAFWTMDEELWKELKKPINDIEAQTMWCEQRVKGELGLDDTYQFTIE
jgi:hypothetical protein